MLDELYARPGFLLRRAHQLSVAIFEDACAPMQLTPSQYAVLVILNAYGCSNQNQLAVALGMSKVTISQTVKALLARHLIARQLLEVDKRQNVLTMTAGGKAVLETARVPAQLAYATFMSPLNLKEQKIFVSLLKKIIFK